MTAYGVADLVVLALDSTGAVDERADGSATTVELSETIAFGESLADRVQLLAALSSLTRSGLVEESVDDADRTRYRLTDAGHDRVAELRTELADEGSPFSTAPTRSSATCATFPRPSISRSRKPSSAARRRANSSSKRRSTMWSTVWRRSTD